MTDTTAINFRGIDLEVEYEYCPAERGVRERGTGVPLEPDWPECIEEVTSITTADNIVDILDENFITDLCEAILAQLNEREDDHD